MIKRRRIEKGRAKAAEQRESEPARLVVGVFSRPVVVRGDTVVRGPGLRGLVRSQLPQQAFLVLRSRVSAGRFSCARSSSKERRRAVRFELPFAIRRAAPQRAPSCPVCLDRLDQDVGSGVVTTVCSHSFHATCLSGWGDSSCPVCRYTQNPEEEARCRDAAASGSVGVPRVRRRGVREVRGGVRWTTGTNPTTATRSS